MILEVQNVVKQYSGHLALDNVSLSVPRGSTYGLLGPNGAGKTTLIRIINRITAPDSGQVLLNGQKLTADAVRNIGYLPEERGLYKKMKVGEQAIYLAQLKGMKRSEAITSIKEWFEKFEIESWWDKKVEELSKGMAQKIQFISTVIHKPELLIFDEPFSGFDPVNAELLKNEILKLRDKGATIIFSTHNMESVEALCENISLVNHSKIVLQGSVAEIKQNYDLQQVVVKTKTAINLQSATIISQEKKNNLFQYTIQKGDKQTNNQLITEITEQTELITFDVLLPTMNDIFINTVKNSNNE